MKSNLLNVQQIKRDYLVPEERNAVIPPCYMDQLTSLTHHWAVWWCPWGARPFHSSSASPDVRQAAGSARRGEGGLRRSSALYQNCADKMVKFNKKNNKNNNMNSLLNRSSTIRDILEAGVLTDALQETTISIIKPEVSKSKPNEYAN